MSYTSGFTGVLSAFWTHQGGSRPWAMPRLVPLLGVLFLQTFSWLTPSHHSPGTLYHFYYLYWYWLFLYCFPSFLESKVCVSKDPSCLAHQFFSTKIFNLFFLPTDTSLEYREKELGQGSGQWSGTSSPSVIFADPSCLSTKFIQACLGCGTQDSSWAEYRSTANESEFPWFQLDCHHQQT